MIVEVNENTNTLMLVILHYFNLCSVFVSTDCHTYYNKICANCTHSAVLGSGDLRHHFCPKFAFKQRSTHLYKKCTAFTDAFLLSFSLLLRSIVQDCTVLQRKPLKGGLGSKISSLLHQFYAQFQHCVTCVLTTLAVVLSPYSFLHPLTELLRLFKRMMKSFRDTMENQLSKSGSQSSSQLLCMYSILVRIQSIKWANQQWN